MAIAERSGTDASRDSARLLARVEGRVQGVGYRAFVHANAVALRLAGWVRNLPSGEVELELEGPRATLESLLQELHTGPPACRVRQIHVEWAPARGIDGFEIRRI